jgi:hypothetical protein
MQLVRLGWPSLVQREVYRVGPLTAAQPVALFASVETGGAFGALR